MNWFCVLVSLVEPSSQPMGVTLVNTVHTNKTSDCMDLVELAHHVQRVRVVCLSVHNIRVLCWNSLTCHQMLLLPNGHIILVSVIRCLAKIWMGLPSSDMPIIGLVYVMISENSTTGIWREPASWQNTWRRKRKEGV